MRHVHEETDLGIILLLLTLMLQYHQYQHHKYHCDHEIQNLSGGRQIPREEILTFMDIGSDMVSFSTPASQACILRDQDKANR